MSSDQEDGIQFNKMKKTSGFSEVKDGVSISEGSEGLDAMASTVYNGGKWNSRKKGLDDEFGSGSKVGTEIEAIPEEVNESKPDVPVKFIGGFFGDDKEKEGKKKEPEVELSKPKTLQSGPKFMKARTVPIPAPAPTASNMKVMLPKER